MVDERGNVEGRFTVALPASGRSVEGRWADTILTSSLPQAVTRAFTMSYTDAAALREHIECCEDQEALRALLPSSGGVPPSVCQHLAVGE